MSIASSITACLCIHNLHPVISQRLVVAVDQHAHHLHRLRSLTHAHALRQAIAVMASAAATASAALSAATATRITSYTLTVTATAGQLLSTVLSVPFAATPSKAPAQSILDGEHTAPNVVSPASVMVYICLTCLLCVRLSMTQQTLFAYSSYRCAQRCERLCYRLNLTNCTTSRSPSSSRSAEFSLSDLPRSDNHG